MMKIISVSNASSSDRERSQSDLFSYFAARRENGESTFEHFKRQPLKKCCQSNTFKSNNVDLNCVKTQNRHWLLLPWLLDTLMEMVRHNNSSLLI